MVGEDLMKLGLPEYASRALETLIAHERMTAMQISEKGQVPYTKVYQILGQLQRLGFIESTEERPKKYAAEDARYIVDCLIQRHRKRVQFMARHCREILKDLETRRQAARQLQAT